MNYRSRLRFSKKTYFLVFRCHKTIDTKGGESQSFKIKRKSSFWNGLKINCNALHSKMNTLEHLWCPSTCYFKPVCNITIHPPPIRKKNTRRYRSTFPEQCWIKKSVLSHSCLLNELQDTPEDKGVNMWIISLVEDFCNRQNVTLAKSSRYLEPY